MKHTPGPWSVYDQYSERPEIRGPEESGVLVCVMAAWGVAADTPSPTQANARLIAAAPELLALCKEWAKAWEEGEFSPDITSRMNAAIAKAEGTKP